MLDDRNVNIFFFHVVFLGVTRFLQPKSTTKMENVHCVKCGMLIDDRWKERERDKDYKCTQHVVYLPRTKILSLRGVRTMKSSVFESKDEAFMYRAVLDYDE